MICERSPRNDAGRRAGTGTAARGPVATVPFVYRFYSRGARYPRQGPCGRGRAAAPVARCVPAGTGGGASGNAGWAARSSKGRTPGVRRRRSALVRPGRVHQRAPDSPACWPRPARAGPAPSSSRPTTAPSVRSWSARPRWAGATPCDSSTVSGRRTASTRVTRRRCADRRHRR
ncbi:hypothetical protein HBB16_03920 [Pseudonocardia sp. MCCB 268]|nr:hypothetical protein [Pseudonocardia cytotoxica]